MENSEDSDKLCGEWDPPPPPEKTNLVVDETIEVNEDLSSDAVIDALRMRVKLCNGLQGRVAHIDSDGNIQVMFPGAKACGFGSGLHWIVQKNCSKLFTQEKSQNGKRQIFAQPKEINRNRNLESSV